ncbi:MAG: PQQ-dependent dehydrogenase, methanol/ethanol family [Pseudomonadales bacterium]
MEFNNLRLLAGVLILTLAACGEQAPSTTPPPAAESAEAGAGEGGGEIGLPALPTHWINTRPIGGGRGPVTDADLDAGTDDPGQWLLYGGNYANYRYSPVASLNPETASRLQVAWAFPTGTLGQFEVSPVVYDGIMYVSSSYNRLFALDARTGELYWRYDRVLPDDLRLCCGPMNRGVGIKGDTVLMATLDAHLMAFNRLSGEILWDVEVADYSQGFSTTSAPFVLKNMAIIGVAGGEYGVRGFFDAYDIETGKRLWRHYTVPGAGEPGSETWEGTSYETGGSPAWTSGAYDPETDTLFWTTGNPSPDWNGDEREGDNLYSNSLLAVDPQTGERKWHFQFTPHDVWDYDGNTQLFLVDIERDGQPVKAVVQANRNGFFYILDRSNGAFLQASPYLEQVNWAAIDDNGRPVVNPSAVPLEDPEFRVCPGNMGGMNGAWTGAFDPRLGLVYIPAIEGCQMFQKGISAYMDGQEYLGGMPLTTDVDNDSDYGHISAINAATGEIRWRFKDHDPMSAGVVATAGGVVISGTQDGHAIALDSATGQLLWKFRVGGGVRSQPIVYELDGDTYVAIGAGNWATIAAFQGGTTSIPEGGNLFVFKVGAGS